MSLRTMIYEYRKSIRLANKAYESAKLDTDKIIIGSMLSDMHYAMAWIHCGHNPEFKRGAYQHSKVHFLDPEIMDTFSDEGNAPAPVNIGDQDMRKLNYALSQLTERETDIYVMHHAEMLPMEEIADLLGVKKSTIATTIRRAQKKINESFGGKS